jgi:hypothetical protein
LRKRIIKKQKKQKQKNNLNKKRKFANHKKGYSLLYTKSLRTKEEEEKNKKKKKKTTPNINDKIILGKDPINYNSLLN